ENELYPGPPGIGLLDNMADRSAPLQFRRRIRYIEAIGIPRVNGRLTRFRHPGTAERRGFFGNVDAPNFSRDRSGGRSGPAGCRPHARRAPAAYLPLRAGWALAPGHSGGCQITRNPRAPETGAEREGQFP